MDLSLELEKAVRGELEKELTRIGEEFVQSAKDGGTYTDRTGRLRSSSAFKVDADGLTLMNTCPYASKVEAMGYEVFSTFALEAYEKLNR